MKALQIPTSPCEKRGFSLRSLTVTARIAVILLSGESEPRP